LRQLSSRSINIFSSCKYIWGLGALKTRKKEKVKATYILLWIGEEGRKIFNSFEVIDIEKHKIDVIFDKFATHVEPKSNFRIARYQLQGSDSLVMNQSIRSWPDVKYKHNSANLGTSK